MAEINRSGACAQTGVTGIWHMAACRFFIRMAVSLPMSAARLMNWMNWNQNCEGYAANLAASLSEAAAAIT